MGCLLCLATCSLGCGKKTPPADLLRFARLALRRSEFAEVETHVRQIPAEALEWQAGQLLAGEAATKDGRLGNALEYYTRCFENDRKSADGRVAVFSAAEVHFEQGSLADAEALYREVLKSDPQNGITSERMAFLMSLTGRRWQALDHYFTLIRGGDATYRELALAADVGRAVEEPEFLSKCKASHPGDFIVRLALATRAFSEGEEDAEIQLQSLVKDSAELTSAHAMLGELIVDSTDGRRFFDWHDSLPSSADESPDIWFVRGLWARKQSNVRIAADCFWQTVSRSPFHRRAFYNLGQVLIAVNDPQAQRVVDYSTSLIHLSKSVDEVLISEANNPVAIQDTAETLEDLGRIWEACAWSIIGRTRFPQRDWHSKLLNRHRLALTENLPRVLSEVNPVTNLRRASVPEFDQLLTDYGRQIEASRPKDSTANPPPSQIRFESIDGFPFQYSNGEDPATRGVRTFEQTGGGVGVVDFDGDTFPDILMPQGGKWKTGDNAPSLPLELHDGLFRNVLGNGFYDASEQLTGVDSGFGQGCSVGDYNNDGFSDLYIANIGRNALYQNMGDGTFSNVTEASAIRDTSWTASTMMCDLNADGLPDIFDVNYLKGDDLFQRICAERACSPGVFEGATDRVLVNQGDGHFLALSDATPQVDSKGLGIVAFEFEKNRRPSVFIANDQVANFFLRNFGSENPSNLELQDDAVISGVAYNDDGLPMACMGIAVDDWDRNSLLDVFVTNFHNEANTLYLQDTSGLFIDATKSVGLYSASIPFVAWGTQPLDANLDGWADIVIANGHLDDYRDEGGEYQMRAQLFQNVRGRFQEQHSATVGPWFAQKHLGRGLARIDWNRDGKPEFAVSIMNAPAAVLKNVSSDTGNFIRFRLYARLTARDAIGARVTVTIADEEFTRQILAGDGYMASNERLLNFGLGGKQTVDKVRVDWPSGSATTFQTPPVNSTFILTESMHTATGYNNHEVASFSVLLNEDAQ